MRVVWLVFLLCISIAQAQPQPNHKNNDEFTYTEDKLGIAVTADHPEFVIKLKSNPTTGFKWFLREYHSQVLMPVKHIYVAATKQLVGASGYELWTFKVKPTGFLVPQQTVVRFVYARPWEGSNQSTQIVFRVSTL